jgi:hypothetical protein
MEVTLLEQFLADPKNCNQHDAKYKKSQKFKKRQARFNPVSLRYLVQHAWGCANSYLCKLRKSQKEFATSTAMTDEAANLLFVAPPLMDLEGAPIKSVIEDYELAETVYTPAYLYAVNECRCKAKDNLDTVDRESYTKRLLDSKRSFESLDNNIKEVWESKHRSHLLRQPHNMNEIISALKKNPKSSWRHIEKEINHWCCDSTIRKWVTSKKGFKVYAERIIPLLSDAQRKKHLDFGKHFRCNWGLGGGKYLLVHYDEKWLFWGLIVRHDAKSCEELGIDPVTFAAYHKSHISKVMATAVTAFAFEDSIENGGDAIKLGLYRAQTHKIARKLQKQSVRQLDGSFKQTGPVIRRKGDLYLVDCCVTGASHGTPDDPKFALKYMFELHVFPEIARLVGPGGEYEGFIPIIQGDNAGPHDETKFIRFVTEHYESKVGTGNRKHPRCRT